MVAFVMSEALLCEVFVTAVVLAGHGVEELVKALCNLIKLSLRLLVLSSAIQAWTHCRQKQ